MPKIPTDRKHFCLAPWVHMQVHTDGNVFPCCIASQNAPFGNIREQSLQEIWNGPKQREFRLKMLRDEPSDTCTRCYEWEKVGSSSHRQDVIAKHFSHHEPLVETTREDGGVPKLNLPFLDIRFSNLCNFRCRTCGPGYSSAWGIESGTSPRVEYAAKDRHDLWKQLEPLVADLEEIYFVGGEPLLMEEHYELLALLVEKKLFHVRLRYNTNFSKPVYNGIDAFELWNKFEDVNVGASLDGMGRRGEYLRKGQHWEATEQNRVRMLRQCPRARFHIAATLSLMNSLHLPDFHRNWVDRGLIHVNDIHVNLLQDPTHYRIQVLPASYKDLVREKYRQHVDYMSSNYSPGEDVKKGFEAAIRFMDAEDRANELPHFLSLTAKLDAHRNEKFTDIFPELMF